MGEVLQGLVKGTAPPGPQQRAGLPAARGQDRHPGARHGRPGRPRHLQGRAHPAGLRRRRQGTGADRGAALRGPAAVRRRRARPEHRGRARAAGGVASPSTTSLPTLDALVSTLLGWRTIQPGLNPIRPDVFVRALQATLARHVPDDAAREALIAPAGGLLGVNLRRLYREAVRLAAVHRRRAGRAAGRRACSKGARRRRRAGDRHHGQDAAHAGPAAQAAGRRLRPAQGQAGVPAHRAGVDVDAAGAQAGRRAGQAAGAAPQAHGRAPRRPTCCSRWPRTSRPRPRAWASSWATRWCG